MAILAEPTAFYQNLPTALAQTSDGRGDDEETKK